jgi:hypothetical protein
LKQQSLIAKNESILIIKIDDFILKKDYLNSIKLYNQLHSSHPGLLEKINQIEIDKQNEIISLFNNGKSELAYDKFQNLSLSTNQINELILNYIKEKNKFTLVKLNQNDTYKVLKNIPESKLTLLKDGDYRLFLDTNGLCKIFFNNNELFNFTVESKNFCSKIKESNFEIPVNSENNFNLKINSNVLSTKYITSTEKFNKERNPNVEYLVNKDIPKNKYWKMELTNSIFLIDNKELKRSQILKFVSEYKLKGQYDDIIYYGVLGVAFGLIAVFSL